MRALHSRHRWCFAFGALALSFSCHSSPPGPTFVRQPTSALIEVPYPPPPARVEALPPQPNDSAVWIDGEWAWTGKRWAWKYGRWVVPPPGAAFSPWTTTRSRDATLYFAPGVWRDASGNEVAAPAAVAVGKATQEDVIASAGEVEQTGRNVRPEGAPPRPRRARSASSEPAPTLDPGFFGDAGIPGDAGPPPADAAPRPDAGAPVPQESAPPGDAGP